MNYEYKNKCEEFFNKLADILKEHGYVIVASPNNKHTRQLVVKGEEKLLTYYGKPFFSIRFSNAWNWYTNPDKCHDTRIIQCLNHDIPWSRKRTEDGKGSKPWFAWQVAYFGTDRRYHCVYGDKFDRETKTWNFVEADPVEVANDILRMLEGFRNERRENA